MCLFVCLSVCDTPGIVSKRLNLSLMNLRLSGTHIILVFWLFAPMPNSKGNPFNGGAKYTGVGKFCDFRLKSPFISETVRNRPMVIWNINRKSYGGASIGVGSDDLERPLIRVSRSLHTYNSNISKTVRFRDTNKKHTLHIEWCHISLPYLDWLVTLTDL